MRRSKHHIDGLMALLLFGVFAACVLSVLLTGAGAYRRLTERDRQSYDRRTCVQYIATRVRQADVRGGVELEAFGGLTALALSEGDYVTRLYCYDGHLMELYAGGEAALSPVDGEPVMALEALEMSLEGGLLTLVLESPQGERDTLLLSLRSAEEARRGPPPAMLVGEEAAS